MAIVTTQTEFRSAITARDPEIILANDITLTTYVIISYTVTIKGQKPSLSLFWGNPTSSLRDMIFVSSAGVLTLESIILDAQNRDGTLVYVSGGTFIMNDDTIIRNVRSTTAQNGVKIGAFSEPLVSGTFIMNGGLVTGIDSSNAVFCTSGSVIMNNNAAVSENTACGVAVATPTGGTIRGSFTMTGNSRVTNNRSKQAGGGVLNLRADMYMGVNDGDAPEISGNRPPSGSYGGGIVMTDNSTLTMRHNAQIWGNYSDTAGGGVIAQDAVITMRDNSSIEDNVCEGGYGGGGTRIHQGSRLILEDNAHISGNKSVSDGGGVYLQPGGYLEMKGDSYVDGNEAVNGAGVYLGPPTASVPLTTSALIGADNSSPSIYNNTSSRYGGGIFIGRHSKLDLTGSSAVSDNKAESGAGIYKMGILNVSQSPKVLDGLFFDDIPDTDGAAYQTARYTDIMIAAEPSEDGSHIVLKAVEQNTYTGDSDYEAKARIVSVLQDPKHTDNVPVITGQLTQLSEIHLEASAYVSPPNVPLVIADKGSEYALLGETDRAAWQIPSDFGLGYAVILNTELNQVLIVYEVYNIKYCHLYGADNPNPDSYSVDSEFPIVLQKPGERYGYEFDGWYNCEGQLVTEIPKGTTGDIQLIALWKENKVFSIKYCHLYGVNNPNPYFYSAESKFPIVLQKPGERLGYIFTGWYDCAGQLVTEIPKGTMGDLLLIALWKEKEKQLLYLHFDGNAKCVSNMPVPIPVHSSESIAIPINKPKRPYYDFVSWNTCPNGTGKNYYPKDKITIADVNVTLYAQWKSICCEDEYYLKDTDIKMRSSENKWY